MTKAMIVVNPTSGNEQGVYYSEELKRTLTQRFDEVTVKVTEKGEDTSVFSKEAADSGFDALFLAGGDGTVNQGINAVAPLEDRPTIGILPMGTVNNFARSLGISPKPEEAIQQHASSSPKKVDIGKVNDLHFVSSVSAGSIPETVQHVDSENKKLFGPLAYLFEGLKVLNDDQTTVFDITMDGDRLEEQFSFILIAASQSVAGIQTFFPSAKMDDGRLHFMGLRETTAGEKLALVPELFQKEDAYSDRLFRRSFQQASFIAATDEPLVSTVDGDKGPRFPIDVRVLPKYLSVFVP